MKKRVITALLMLILAFSLITPAAAANTKNYTLESLNLTLEVPADWITVTQETEDDAVCREYFNMTAEELRQALVDRDTYLDSVDPVTGCEISISLMLEQPIDLNYLDDEQLNEIADYCIGTIENNGFTFTDFSYYEQAYTKFIELNFWESSENARVYWRQYYTVYNGQAISIILQCYDGEIPENAAQICEDVVDSITFTKAQIEPSSTQASTAESSKTQTSQVQASESEPTQAHNSSGETFTPQVFIVILCVIVLVITLVGVLLAVMIRRERNKAAAEIARAQAAFYNNNPSPQTFPAQYTPAQPAPAQAIPAQNNSAAKLAQLKELLDSGLITMEEFDTKKAEILKNL